jgi:hypothetical protein
MSIQTHYEIKRDRLGRFLKGVPAFNKGKTLEDLYGEERANEIRARLSEHSKKKGDLLRALNKNPEYLTKRVISRKRHEEKVRELLENLRKNNERVFALSQYCKDEKQPDLILFKDGKLIAIELEARKKYKPSEKTIISRYERMHKKHGFFDEVRVIFFD